MAYTTRTTCRVCADPRLTTVLSLGDLYINDFIERGKQVEKAPLELVLCKGCSLLQLRHTAPQELLYARYYWYRSGVTETMRVALRDITARVETCFDLEAGDVVVDLGSNDGTLIRSYEAPGLVRVGVEPARNLAASGREGCDVFIDDFWSYERYRQAVGRPARVITAIGMFYDMEDPNAFIADAARALAPDGVFVAQLMCLRDMIELCDVGNVCHEHLEYYSFAALESLFARHDLEIFDCERNAINGGSYRLFVRRRGASVTTDDGAPARLDAIRRAERDLQNEATYARFRERIESNRDACVDFVRHAVEGDKRVWVYGASSKGNTILQYYGLDHSLIEGASDRSPEKWGKYTVGTMIPIYSEDEARARRPDYFLVMPYAFIDEFYAREKAWREAGGTFVLPLPEFKVLS
jgi:hypothetical protein